MIQKIILRKKQIMQKPLSFGKNQNEKEEEPNQDSSDSGLYKDKVNQKQEVFHPEVETPKTKPPPVPKISRKIAMHYSGSKTSLF